MKTIMQSDEAVGRRALAQQLATTTDMNPEAAIAVLRTSPRQAPAATTTRDQFSRHMQSSPAAGAPADASLH